MTPSRERTIERSTTVRVAMTAIAVPVVRIAVLVIVMPVPVRVLVIIVGMIVLRRSGRRVAGTWLLAAHRRLRAAFEVCLGRAARASCAAR